MIQGRGDKLVAELLGVSASALLIIACIRETFFGTDLTRMSWVKGGFASIPFIFFVRGLGGAESGAFVCSRGYFKAAYWNGLSRHLSR